MKPMLDRFVCQLAVVMLNQKTEEVKEPEIFVKLALGTHTAKGSYGDYWKLSEDKGIKVLRDDFKSIDEAKASYTMTEAKIEADYFIKCKVTGIVPECFGTKIVMVGDNFRVGILMEHLGDTRLMEYASVEEQYSIRKELEQKFADFGVIRYDLHNENIMVKNGKFYAIDFTPHTVSIIDESKLAA